MRSKGGGHGPHIFASRQITISVRDFHITCDHVYIIWLSALFYFVIGPSKMK